MGIRDRLANTGQDAKPTPTSAVKPVAVSVPDVLCVYRSRSPVGKIKCGCSNSPSVFTCAEPWVQSGYCVPRDPTPGAFPPDGPIILTEGGSVLPSDNRVKAFATWPLRAGEVPTPWQVPVCATCPKRIEPPPHICRLQQLGIQGNYEPDTGHCGILHTVPPAEHWVQHAADYVASSPDGMRSCFSSATKGILSDMVTATACRLIVSHTGERDSKTLIEAAEAHPEVKFWCVLHGSQNSMSHQERFAKHQAEILVASKRLPNLWYGTPELTADFRQFGFERYVHWPNPMPFDSPPVALRLHDTPVLLISSRDDVIKGNAAKVIAAGLIARSRAIHVEVAVKGSTAAMQQVAATVGVKLEIQPIRTQIKFREYIRSDVDVVLSSSLTDADQYVGRDALSQGRPVVGSDTIRYLPATWQADPNDPADIARVALMFLADYDRYSAEALRLGCEIRDRQREAYHAAIARILQ